VDQGDSGEERERRPKEGREPAPGRPSDQTPEESAKQARDDDPESASRAFDVLERFAGELEEILHSLERAKSIPPPPASAEPAPAKEPPYRPSSIHFERGSISGRIDPDAMRPLSPPPSASRSGLRLTFEAFFLILVAAISAQSGLRWPLIVGAEAVAFLIVALVEVAVARDQHPLGVPLLPAAPPALSFPLARDFSGQSQSAFEDVEPLVWSVEKSELVEVVAEIETEPEDEAVPEAEPSWPLAAIEPETKPDRTEVETGKAESHAPLESTIEITTPPAVREDAAAETAEPLVPSGEAIEQEAPAAEPEVEAARHRRLFRRRTVRPVQPEETEPAAEEASVVEPELALENSRERHPRHSRRQRKGLAETPAATEIEVAPEAGPAPELGADREPRERRRWFGARVGQATEPPEEEEPEPRAEPEPAVTGRRRLRLFHLTGKTETEAEVRADAELEPESEPGQHRRWFGAQHEAAEEDRAAFEPEPESESKRGFHLFRHVDEPEGESDEGLESAIEIATPFDLSVEAEDEKAPALEPESESKRGFHLFRHVGDARIEPEPSLENTIEIPAPEKTQAEASVQEPDTKPELTVDETKARRQFSSHRHRERSEVPEEKTSIPTNEFVEELEDDPGRDRFVRRRPAWLRHEAPGEARPVEPSLEAETEHADPAAAASTAEATAEIELPQGISIREIEQTLDELESRRPRARKRHWHFRADALEDVEAHSSPADAELEEALRLENEFRLSAEQERRRREREYQRSLRN
jgi:hypothetical protein